MEFLRNNLLGAIAIFLIVLVLVASSEGDVAAPLGSNEVTTISNPHVFTNSVNLREDAETITDDNVITTSESGTTFYISGAIATSTLPAVSTAGQVFRFVVAGSLTGNHIVLSAAGDDLEGHIIVNGTSTAVNAADRVIISGTAEDIGDWYEFRSDGDDWHVSGSCLNASCASSDG